jgi:hypothetical protein
MGRSSDHTAREANPRVCSKQNDGAAGFSAPTGEIPQVRLAGGGETLKRSGFPAVTASSSWRSSCPYQWRASRVSSRSLFDRADAGSWAKRQPAVQGLVSRHHVRRVPASGLHHVPKRERPRQLQNRRRRDGCVCSRRRAANRRRSGRAERRRCSTLPTSPFAY